MKTNASAKKELSSKQRDELLAVLQARFEENLGRHPGLAWAKVQARLEANPEKLWSLYERNAPAANRMSSATTRNPANSFSSIVPSKVPPGARVCATTARR